MVKTKPTLPPKTEFKSLYFERKSIDEDQGIITGYLSTFGNVDLQNDRVTKGAFSKTVTEGKSRMQTRGFIWPVLWMHDPEQPIGKVTDAQEDDHGLLITAHLDISTNSQGIPNNPKAVMVFSGFKSGFISELSMGYIAIQKDYDKGVRNLKECAVLEASGVTSLFAANPEALVPASGVKSMLTKSASGSTSLPLAARDAAWDGSAAHNKVVELATKDDGTLDASIMKQAHFWFDESAPENITSYKLIYADVIDEKLTAVPKGIFGCAGALQGARGTGVDIPESDIPGVKKKIASWYKKMAKEFDDDTIKPSWEDDGKRRAMNGQQRKDFNDLYQSAQAADCLEGWGDLINTLTQAMMQLFCMGDQPQEDMTACLEQFNKAVMDWVDKGMQCGLAEYLNSRYGGNNTPYVPYNLRVGDDYGYMARRTLPDGKVGATISRATQGTLEQHQAEMKAMLDDHNQMVADSCKAMQQKVSDLTQLWQEEGQGDAYGNDNGKSRLTRREPPRALTREQQPPISTAKAGDITIENLTIDDLATLLV